MTVSGERDALVAALTARDDLADWSVRVVTSHEAWRDLGAAARGARVRTTIAAELHRDTARGRGTSRLVVDSGTDARSAVALAIARADVAQGPVWRSPAPAAPARVDLLDPDIDPTQLDRAVDVVVERLTAAAPRGVVAVGVDDIELVSRRGQRARWRASAATLRAAATGDGGPGAIALRARRLADLQLAAVVGDTPAAPRLAPGRYPIAIAAAALLHGDRGLLAAFAAQADPALERQGLVRYRAGEPVATDARLSLDSDGTLPFGWYSAPLGDHGEAVRRFPLVRDGVAVGLGLDPREAALRGQLPNGGVRGLVVPAGDHDDADLVRDAVVIERFTWLDVDPMTGWFRAGTARGTLRGDAIALLARARTSRSIVTSPTYVGPAWWHLGEVAVD